MTKYSQPDNFKNLGISAESIFVKKQFSESVLSENCLLHGTDNVQGKISVHIFAPNGGH